MDSDPSQLALRVDPDVMVHIEEGRDGRSRTLRVGPLAEPDARLLAGFLLSRSDAVDGDGPWRCAVAGGSRTVRLARERA